MTCLIPEQCIQCLPSYQLIGTSCTPKMAFPCLSQNQSGCILCASTYSLSNFTCVPNLICNSYKNCKNCPLSRFLFQGLCLGCPTIANCYQCFSSGTGCAKCVSGYFPNGMVCLACPNGCSECISSNFCTAASSGYLLTTYGNIGSGKVMSCSPYCKTCEVTSSRCTSCPDNYTQTGFSCVSSQNTAISLVFNPAFTGWNDTLSTSAKNQLLM